MAWMDLDAPLDITIGPYETYNDELFGYKAAFEAYVNVRERRRAPSWARSPRTCRRSRTPAPRSAVSQSQDGALRPSRG